MRRLAVVVPLALLAAGLLARRRRRSRARDAPLGAASPAAPAALLESGTRFVSVPWTLVAAPPDRAQLTLRYACDERVQLDRVDAQETPTQVFVTVLVRWSPASASRSADRREREATVALGSPLGTRELVPTPVDPDPSAGEDPSDPPLYP
jgi:hypothetical protein